ncbi:MAG TPA: serine hydrolase, partial [Blastocatellia bacterium]|nr:serine hydrolase [Blastocatellia bacterium]
SARDRTPAADQLGGLWGIEQKLGPRGLGELVVDGGSSEWKASITGLQVPVSREGDNLKFVLPNGAGEFRAHFKDSGKSLTGFWIQPANAVFDNRYASPIHFRQIGNRRWQGQVAALEQGISLYVSVQREPDGALNAFIRNPEFNPPFCRRLYHVELQGTTVSLSQGKFSLQGSFDSQTDTLALSLIDGQAPLQLSRRVVRDAPGFYPRVQVRGKYAYTPPATDGDGWRVGTLREAGFDEGPIAQLIQKILDANPKDNPLPIQSLTIARHGKLVLDEYFYGFHRDRPHDTRSAGKTFAPMLVGMARARGARIGPDTPVYSLFSRYEPFANWDERKQKMRLKDLMSMTAGYDCDEDHGDFPGNEDAMQGQTTQPDWYKYMLDAPMAHDPGGDRAYYCSGELNLAAGAAAVATNTWLPYIFEEDCARPLQFRPYAVNLMPTGQAYFGGGAYIRPRDQLKLGQLYLSGGIWNGRRVIDAEWVRQSLIRHSTFEDRFGVDHQYGWGWHIHHLKVGGKTYVEYESGGNGGQLVLIIPQLDMVVGMTGGAYGEFGKWGHWSLELVPDYVIRAVKS